MANKKTFFFTTNITGGSSISRVRPYLEEIKEILYWEVDTNHPKKILTIEAENEAVIEKVKFAINEAGFDIESIKI